MIHKPALNKLPNLIVIASITINDMPIGALLRNLGSLTQLGILGANTHKNLKHVTQVLNSKDRLRKGRIHPIGTCDCKGGKELRDSGIFYRVS
jgi:TROVE domain